MFFENLRGQSDIFWQLSTANDPFLVASREMMISGVTKKNPICLGELKPPDVRIRQYYWCTVVVYIVCVCIYIYTHPYAYSIKLKTLPSAKWLFGCWFQLCRYEKPIDDIDIGWWDDGAQILTVHSQYVGAYWAILGHQHNCLLHCTQLHHWPMAVAQVVGAATSMLPWLQK